MNFPLFIARRIYGKGAGSQKVAKPAIRIATAGVAIGLAVMIVTVSVILGFKHTIRDKVVGFGSHITVANIASLMSSDQYPIQMDDSMTTVLRAIPGVRHVERYAMTQGILKTDDDFLGVFSPISSTTKGCARAASPSRAFTRPTSSSMTSRCASPTSIPPTASMAGRTTSIAGRRCW